MYLFVFKSLFLFHDSVHVQVFLLFLKELIEDCHALETPLINGSDHCFKKPADAIHSSVKTWLYRWVMPYILKIKYEGNLMSRLGERLSLLIQGFCAMILESFISLSKALADFGYREGASYTGNMAFFKICTGPRSVGFID